jgi:hypothetical protein
MNTNIDLTSINKYFNINNENPENNANNITKYRSIITHKSPLSDNEITVSQIISQIPYYTNFFSVLHDYDQLNVDKLNENVIEKLKITENMNYYLFKYNDQHCIDFTDYLYNFKSIKKLCLYMIDTLLHLLNGLSILHSNKVCFFNISPQNIIFLEHYREKPVLSDFRLSLQVNELDYHYISIILNKLDDFTYQPFEIHILFYFVKNHISTISYSFIEEFCENFVENLPILMLFSANYKQTYKSQCIETMKKYINHSQTDIINDILERNDKWDVYGASLLYLKIFGSISRTFSLNQHIISKITMLLLKNIHPNSDKRMSLENTANSINKLLNEPEDWIIFNKLDNRKIEQLMDEFSK